MVMVVVVVGLWKGMNLQTKAYTYKEKGKENESNQREMETMMDNLNFHPLCRRPLTNVLIHHLGIDFCFFLYFLILSLSLSHQYSTFQQCPTKVIIRQKKKKKNYSCARDSNKSNYTSKVILTTWIQNLKKRADGNYEWIWWNKCQCSTLGNDCWLKLLRGLHGHKWI